MYEVFYLLQQLIKEKQGNEEDICDLLKQSKETEENFNKWYSYLLDIGIDVSLIENISETLKFLIGYITSEEKSLESYRTQYIILNS